MYGKRGDYAMSIESNVQSDVVFYNIVVPHDLTARSDKAVQMASSMAHPLRSNILLINVIDPSDWHGLEHADFLSEMMDLARDRSKMLRTVAERLLHADVKFDVCVLFGIAESVILAEARKTGGGGGRRSDDHHHEPRLRGGVSFWRRGC